ncbi:SDR family oxidoreductase [Companilactobacillus furfuricola]|uniref:SDR family oxidoreductase n=1 Tax=Companilactobacillus furfuricola TaxID=1462575 RepID=UPI000F7ABFD7|nr:SDR family oxidoreductase [Companilactobacillus furfuricola]
MKYAITGSTGKFGLAAVNTLLENVAASDVVALARNEEKAKKLLPAGVEIRPGSYEDVDQLASSLKDVDRLLFVSSQPGGKIPRLQQHQNVITAAQKANVKFIAYTSFPQADQSNAPLAQDHKETEKIITATGIKHAFLRNNWYVENEMSVIDAGNQDEAFVYSAADGYAGWALERFYAEAAAKVLISDDPKDIYEFAGASHTYAELAEAVKEATGNNFEVRSLSDAEYSQGLQDSGLDKATADMITSFQTLIRDGNLDENTSDLPDVLGHALPSLTDSVKEVLAKKAK